MTRVVNLCTGDEILYGKTPVESVILAFHQNRGNFNWWNPGYWDIPVLVGRISVSCDDFCAMKRQPRRRS